MVILKFLAQFNGGWWGHIKTGWSAITTGLSWLSNEHLSCKDKYKNNGIYNLFIGTIKRVKHNIGIKDAKVYDKDIFNAQDLYTKFLEAEKNGTRKEQIELLRIGFRKFFRFFPTYQNYLNLCGYASTDRTRCKFYNVSGRAATPAFVKEGYLLRLLKVMIIKLGLHKRPKLKTKSWWNPFNITIERQRGSRYKEKLYNLIHEFAMI